MSQQQTEDHERAVRLACAAALIVLVTLWALVEPKQALIALPLAGLVLYADQSRSRLRTGGEQQPGAARRPLNAVSSRATS